MEITAKMVSELRSRTGAGIMDCKKALTETNGNIDQAIQKLREEGLRASELKGSPCSERGVDYLLYSPRQPGRHVSRTEL